VIERTQSKQNLTNANIAKGEMNMKIATIIVRSLLGLIFVTFGSNMFLNFIPTPPPPQGPAGEFMSALFVSHYIYVLGAFQVVGGLALLSGRWSPLGLALVGPVIVNILSFHVLMAPAGLPMAAVVSALALFLLWSYRKNFAGLVQGAAVQPDSRNHQIASRTVIA
jgi:putative oxidoreductase